MFQGSCSLVAKHCRSAITLAMLGLQLRVGPDQLGLSVASLGARLRPWRARTKALAPGRMHWKKARSRSATKRSKEGVHRAKKRSSVFRVKARRA